MLQRSTFTHKSYSIKRFVLTGPESSGKTTLAQKLSEHFDTIYVPEYARIYLESKGTLYDLPDLVNIAIGQLALASSLEESLEDKNLIFLDTWMLELCVWSQYRFGVVPDVLAELYHAHPPHHYFLCKPDIDWQADPLRENPLDRDVLFRMYETSLLEGTVPYSVVSGSGRPREQLVIDRISQLMLE